MTLCYYFSMKVKKQTVIFLGIMLLGAILRILFLDKPEGLWYDETIIYKQASQPDIFSVIAYTNQGDVQFPLYQIILHIWSKLFSFSDFSLRMFSSLCGILTVLTSYYVGKNLKSEKTGQEKIGLICAGIFAVNSFLIYYSQEVKMYALSGLFSTLLLLFVIKIKNNSRNKVNYIGLMLASVAAIYTYIIAFVFVFIQNLALAVYMLNQEVSDKKLVVKKSLFFFLCLIIFCAPVFAYLFINRMKYAGVYNSVYSDWSSILVFLQDWFSPIIKIVNPINYGSVIFSNINLWMVIFIFIPVLIAIYFIFNALKRDKFSFVLFFPAIMFILIEFFAKIFTNFEVAPRYTFIIIPSLLILVGFGFVLTEQKKLAKVLISLFLGINLFYLLFSPDAAFRMPRNGYKQLANVLNASSIKQDDFVVVWNRDIVLEKYIPVRLNVLSLLKNFVFTSEVILYNEKYLNSLSVEKRKTVLRKYFSDEKIPKNSVYIMDVIYNRAKKGQKFIIISDERYESFNQKNFRELVKEDKKYQNTSLNDLYSIKSLIALKNICFKKFKFIKKEKAGFFVVYIFEK